VNFVGADRDSPAVSFDLLTNAFFLETASTIHSRRSFCDDFVDHWSWDFRTADAPFFLNNSELNKSVDLDITLSHLRLDLDQL
jgi:hypothetical protein